MYYYKLPLLCAIFCGALALGSRGGGDVKEKRQVGSVVLQKDDHQGSETGFVGGGPAAIHHGSKYFQYAHVPTKDHYEHGHKRGNEHHFIERHEKAHPHAGEFKTKVRWGDKHGGYGEHYWDYNHAGHGHDGEGEESQTQEEYANYDAQETQQAPLQERVNRAKREPIYGGGVGAGDVEFINDNARSLALGGAKHGGNYRHERDFRGKREGAQRIDGKALVWDEEGQVIVDKKTGVAYQLNKVNY